MANKLKLIICGDILVGKTSIIRKYMEQSNDYLPTIGIATYRTKINVRGEETVLDIYDTAGDERYRSILPAFFRRANVAIVVFSIDRHETYEHLQYWANTLDDYCPDILRILVCNKIDLDHKISEEELRMAQSIFRVNQLVMTSAITGDGIQEIFNIISDSDIQLQETVPGIPTEEFNEAFKDDKKNSGYCSYCYSFF